MKYTISMQVCFIHRFFIVYLFKIQTKIRSICFNLYVTSNGLCSTWAFGDVDITKNFQYLYHA